MVGQEHPDFVLSDTFAPMMAQVRAAPHVRAEADAKGRSLAPHRGPFEEHEQALKAAAAAAEEVERFAAELPPLPEWDSLPVPADAVDEQGTQSGSRAKAEVKAAAEGGGGAASAPLPPSAAEAGPASGGAPAALDQHTGAADSAAAADVQHAVAEQPTCADEGAAVSGAGAMELDVPTGGEAAADAAFQAASSEQPAATDAADAEALALADLAADASAFDRRCTGADVAVLSILSAPVSRVVTFV